MAKYIKDFFCILTAGLVAGCSSFSSDWPSLSDKIADSSERERAHESAPPTEQGPKAEESITPHTPSTAIKLLTATKAKLEAARATYESAKETFLKAEDETALLWREAQLELTRYSRLLNKLDSILISKQLMDHAVWQNAKNLEADIEAHIAAERQELNSLQPE